MNPPVSDVEAIETYEEMIHWIEGLEPELRSSLAPEKGI
jgi:hypothetical protein